MVMKAVGAPLRSRIALVATVEPCTRSSTPASMIAAASSAASAPWSGRAGVLATLPTITVSPSIATRSVKVPPTSTPTRMKDPLSGTGYSDDGEYSRDEDCHNIGGGEMATDEPKGLKGGLTNYGDPDFSIYLRRSFASSMGYSREMLARPSSASPIRPAASTTATARCRS